MPDYPMKYFIPIVFLFALPSLASEVSLEARRSLEPFIEEGEISGAVALVAREGEILSF